MADKALIIVEAQKYLAKGQLDKAISEWEKLIRESPDGNTHNTIGDLYLKKGDKKAAVDSFHKAADFFRNEGFILKALALYKKVLNINSGDVDALYSLGQLSEEKGLGTDAIKYYLAAADMLSKEGKKDRLLETYEKILSLSPSNIPLRNKVAEIFLKEGLKSSATKEYVQIAALYEEKGDRGKSKDYFQKALDIQPLNKEAALGLGAMYEKAGELDKAINHMKEVSVLLHEDSEVLCRYAQLLNTAGRREDAMTSLTKVVEKDPGNVNARMLLGGIFLDEGERERAWSEYLPILDELIRQGKNEEAIGLLERFRDMDPIGNGEKLASIYRQSGNNASLASELELLGDAMAEQEMRDEALKFYREALETASEKDSLQAKIDGLTGQPASSAEPSSPPESVQPPSAELLQTSHPDIEENRVFRQSEEELTAAESGKTADEIFAEANVLVRYGLIGEAIKLLEKLKLREPRNVDLHMKLKSLYRETSDRESAVTEYLILSQLFKAQGDVETSDKMFREAFEFAPADPRLAERGLAVPAAPEAADPAAAETPSPISGAQTTHSSEIEDYEEEISEAEFYIRQGLTQEAAKILEKLHQLFPEDIRIREKLDSLGQVQEQMAASEAAESIQPLNETVGGNGSGADSAGGLKEDSLITGNEYESLTISDQDLVDAQEIPEPTLDADVLEIFQEFKKGLEKELGDQDSETHYNLGIAYKEMGLVDDAIKEFQASRDDPKMAVSSSTMLGVCYMEKGLHSLAIEVLQKAIDGMKDKGEPYWAVRYDLAEAYEKSNNPGRALELYTEVYGWNAKFRDVSDKISRLEARPKTPGSEKPKPEKQKTRKDRVSYL